MLSLDGTVCRVCLRSKGTISLFDDEGTHEIFSYCTLLTVAKDDGLPGKLCQLCAGLMRSAYDFRFQANYAEEYFRKTIFLPVLKHGIITMQIEQETQKFVPCTAEAVCPELVVLDEHMQEIDKLLLKQDNTLEEVSPTEKYLMLPVEAEASTGTPIEEETNEREDHKGEHYKYDRSEIAELCGGFTEEDLQSTKKCINNENVGSEVLISENVDTPEKMYDMNIVKSNQSPAFLTEQQPKPKSKRRSNTHSNKNIECNICGTTFTHVNSLKQHLMKHSGARPFQCEFCEKNFARRTILNIHRRLHTGERPYSCEDCVQTFVTREALNRHKERVHSEEVGSEVLTIIANQPSYICDICQQTRNSKNALLAHMRTHHAKAPLKKSNSCKPLRKPRGVERLSQKLVDQNGRPLSTVKYCKICQQGFASKWELVMHEKEHNGVPMYECDVCQQRFEKKYQLLCHLQTHENGHVLQQKCLKSSGKRSQLTNIAASSDEDDDKPLAVRLRKCKVNTQMTVASNNVLKEQKSIKNALKCLQCKQSFSEYALMQAHLRRHASLERQYACEHCGKKFSRKYVLSLHQKLHCSSESAYKCPLCGDVFVDKENLLYHLGGCPNRREPSKYASVCMYCHEVFLNTAVLEEHMALAHAADREVPTPATLSYECNLCASKFCKLSTYTRHLEMHTPPATQQCDLCAAKFKECFELRYHLKLHKLGGQPCKKCGEVCITKEQLFKHIKAKHFTKCNLDYQCPECTEMLYDMRDLKVHLQEVHDISSAELNGCDLCSCESKSCAAYYTHMHEQHDSIHKYCDECDELFESRRAFERHVFGHYL